MPASGRVVEVDAARLAGWVERFAERHGEVAIDPSAAAVVITAADGARAEITIPYGTWPGPAPGTDPISWLAEHVRLPRTVGVLLARRSGWAVGVVEEDELVASAAGGGHVQGRTKAGGWSQQRYARRRSNQAEQLWQRAADGAVSVLLPHRTRLTALFTGGDRGGIAAVLADERLTGLASLVVPRFFAVGDPTRSVLIEVVRRLSAVVITLNELA
ncbi:MAG TPA: acVLRF1 family peptidyl-tRNA hydrolase [Microlunatus sp.]|nr:acVLRF1 family peptidyl-tRNA hydrolase [Microlunatus sp.]